MVRVRDGVIIEDLGPQWVPGSHIPDEFRERPRRVQVMMEFDTYGSAVHLDRTLSRIERSMELIGLEKPFLHVVLDP